MEIVQKKNDAGHYGLFRKRLSILDYIILVERKYFVYGRQISIFKGWIFICVFFLNYELKNMIKEIISKFYDGPIGNYVFVDYNHCKLFRDYKLQKSSNNI